MYRLCHIYFHLTTLKVTYEQAKAEYEKSKEYRLGRLVAKREVPVLEKAAQILKKYKMI